MESENIYKNFYSNHQNIIKAFKEKYNSTLELIEELPQDASLRKYYRVNAADSTYILMDCYNDRENFTEFFEVQQILKNNDIFVPEVLLKDEQNYAAILQDLGNIKLKDLIINMDKDEQYNTYTKILEILSSVQKIKISTNFPIYGQERLILGIKTFINWYLPYKNVEISEQEKLEFLNLWQEAFSCLSNSPQVITLLDFHVENIMVTNGKMVLIDFQDAALSWSAYDLVSLLQDARHEIDFDIAKSLLQYYCKINSFDAIIMSSDYNILGAQRNSRILGVFARKYLKEGSDKYLKFLPLVLKYLNQNMNSVNALKPLRTWMLSKGIF